MECNYLVSVGCSEVNGQEGQPDDTRGVHGESNEFRLVKVLGDLACLDGVDGANDDEQHIEDLTEEQRRIFNATLQNDLITLRVDIADARRF